MTIESEVTAHETAQLIGFTAGCGVAFALRITSGFTAGRMAGGNPPGD